MIALTRAGNLATPGPATQMAKEGAASGNLRSLAVTIGPSLFLDALVAFSTAATVRGNAYWAAGVRRRTKSSVHPTVRALGALGLFAPWIYFFKVRPWVLHWGGTPVLTFTARPASSPSGNR